MKTKSFILAATAALMLMTACTGNSQNTNNQINTTMETIKTRKSVRVYLDRPVEQEKVVAIAEAGNMAAKAAKVSFYAVTNPEVLRMIADTSLAVMRNSGNEFLAMRANTPGFDPIYNAPAAIVVTTAAGGNFGNETNVASAGCAGENMLLAATSLGLGSCYTVSPTLAFANPTVRQRVGMGEDETPACVIVFGYTDDNAPHAPRPANPGNIKYIE